MFLQELLLSGVRNFTKLKKIGFSKGFNIIVGENGSGKTTIYDSILSILFGSFYSGTNALLCEGEHDCKAALTFQDKNNETYRIIKDYSKNKANLFKLDSSKNFIIINKNKEMIEQLLISELIGLKEEEYAYLFSIKYPLYTSNGLYEVKDESKPIEEPYLTEPVDAMEPMEGFEGNSLEEAGSLLVEKIKNDEELSLKEKRLGALKDSLTKADQLSKIEYKIDDIQNKISENRKRLESIDNAAKELTAAVKGIESLAVFSELPPDISIDALVENYEKREKERAEDLQNAGEELEILKGQRSLIPNKPIFQNVFFIAGIVLIVASLFSVISFNLTGIFQILFLVGFFGGGGSIAFSIFNDFHNNNKRKVLDAKINSINKELNTTNTRYGKEDALFQDILKKTSSGNAQELGLKYKKYNDLINEKKILEEKLERSLDSRQREEIEEGLNQLQKEKAELESKVQGYIGLSTDIYDIQAEIKKIEKEISAYKGGTKNEGRKDASLKRDAIDVKNHANQTEVINWPILERMLGKNPRDLLPLIENKAKLYLQRLTLGRYNGLSFNGGIQIFTKDEKTELDRLSRGVKDQAYLALHLALTSILSVKFPFPLLIDDPFLAFDPQRESIAVDILREMGKENQIIFLSSRNSQKHGDNVIQL